MARSIVKIDWGLTSHANATASSFDDFERLKKHEDTLLTGIDDQYERRCGIDGRTNVSKTGIERLKGRTATRVRGVPIVETEYSILCSSSIRVS